MSGPGKYGCAAPSVNRSLGAAMSSPAITSVIGALVNLNHPAHTVDWHFIHLSVANVVVIGLMLVVFALAIVLPFPGAAKRERERSR